VPKPSRHGNNLLQFVAINGSKRSAKGSILMSSDPLFVVEEAFTPPISIIREFSHSHSLSHSHSHSYSDSE